MQTSSLKQQFPLSPKKFWKKMTEKSIIFFIVSLLFSVIYALWRFSLEGNINNFSPSWSVAINMIPIFLVFFIVLMGIYAVYIHYYIKLYYYADDQDFLTIKKGVITPAQIHVQYAKIQDVYVDQDLLDRIFGIYDVHISSATYTSGIEAHIDGVDKASAEGLKNLLLQKIKKGSGYTTSTQTSETSVEQNSTTNTAEEIHNVHFSKPVSSETYGLGDNWWTGEFVKVALASVFIPGFITGWLILGANKKTAEFTVNWPFTFKLWLGILVVYVLYRLIYLYLWKKHYKYDFGPEFIYMKIGVIAVSEKNMGYNSIQDVQVTQSLVDRIFGVADLVIENASGGSMPIDPRYRAKQAAINGIVIEGLSLSDARTIADELKKVISNKKDNSKGL